MTDDAQQSPPVLDYAQRTSRTPRNRLTLSERLGEAGPWFFRPSLRSVVACLVLLGATVWLSRVAIPWKHLQISAHGYSNQNGAALASSELAVVESDFLVHLWDLDARRRIRSFAGPPGFGVPFEVVMSADGSRVLSHDGNNIVCWDSKSGQMLSRWLGAGGLKYGYGRWQIAAADPTPDGSHILVVGNDDVLRLWQMTTPVATLVDSSGGGGTVAWGAETGWSSDGQHFLVKFGGGLIVGHIDDLTHKIQIDWRIQAARKSPPTAMFVPKASDTLFAGDLVDSATSATRTGWWRVSDGRFVRALPVSQHVEGVAFSPDLSKVAVGGDGYVSIWEVSSATEISRHAIDAWQANPWAGTTRQRHALAWLGNDLLTTNGVFCDEVIVYRASDFAEVARLAAPTSYEAHPTFATSSGRRLIVSGNADELDVWEWPANSDEGTSHAGMFGLSAWWVVVVSAVVVAWSLCRDARRTAAHSRQSRAPRAPDRAVHRVAVMMSVCGSVSLAILCGWFTMGGWTAVSIRIFRWDHGGVWIGLLLLIGGVGLSTGGSGWRILAGVSLAVSLFIAAAISQWLSMLRSTPWRILDRTFDVPRWFSVAVWAVVAVGCLGIFIKLIMKTRDPVDVTSTAMS
jgi:WD40 repeat protein